MNWPKIILSRYICNYTDVGIGMGIDTHIHLHTHMHKALYIYSNSKNNPHIILETDFFCCSGKPLLLKKPTYQQ